MSRRSANEDVIIRIYYTLRLDISHLRSRTDSGMIPSQETLPKRYSQSPPRTHPGIHQYRSSYLQSSPKTHKRRPCKHLLRVLRPEFHDRIMQRLRHWQELLHLPSHAVPPFAFPPFLKLPEQPPIKPPRHFPTALIFSQPQRSHHVSEPGQLEGASDMDALVR